MNNIDIDRAYDIFKASYEKTTGKAWDKDKFLNRASNWKFYGDEKGYVAVREQKSGMVKLVGVAGSPKSVYKGITQIMSVYSNKAIWGAASKDIVDMLEKLGFKIIRPTSFADRMIVKMLIKLIPSSVFGNVEISKINDDGSLVFNYNDTGNASKFIFGNSNYIQKLKEMMTNSDKLPTTVKTLASKFLDHISK